MEVSDFNNVLGGSLLSNLFSDLGYAGSTNNAWDNNDVSGLNWLDQSSFLTNEGGSLQPYTTTFTPEAKDFLENYKFNWQQTGPNNTGTLTAFDKSNKLMGKWDQKDMEDPLASLALGIIAAPLAPGLAGMFGGGLTGGALAGGTLGGATSVAQGGKFGDGFLTGALGGGIGSFNPAGKLGLTNPIAQRAVNAVIGGTAAGVARGQDFEDALKGATLSGAMGAGTSIMNNFFGNLFDNMMGSSNTSLPEMSNIPAENASYAMDTNPLVKAGVIPGASFSRAETPLSTLDSIGLPLYSSDPRQNASYSQGYTAPGQSVLREAGVTPEMSYAAPNSGGYTGLDIFSGGGGSTNSGPTARPQSFSLPSFGELGKFAANNAGTLAQMLFGMYNNRRQQRLIGDQIAGLRGLYGQNSPYAQQLRSRLNAQAAAGGRRSNTGARETQLQAMLADKAASLAPALSQMQMGQNQLRNTMIDIGIGGIKNLKGLGELFGVGG